MKTNRLSTIAIAAALLLALVLSIASALPLRAETPPRSQTLNLDRGQSQLIDHLMKDSKPTIRVIDNPHALILHDEVPGQVLLLGAERGQWEVTVTRDDGLRVAYQVHVAAIASGSTSLDPGTGPITAVAPETNKLDAPVALHPTSATDAFSSDDLRAEAPAPSKVDAMPIQTADEYTDKAASVYRDDPRAPTDDAQPDSQERHYLPAEAISMMNGTSQVIDFPQRLRRISISDSSVADVEVITPFELNLIGHKPGFTTLTVWTGQGRYTERQVRVSPDGKQQVLLNCLVAELDRGRIEDQGTNLSIALQNLGVSLVGLPGPVATPYSSQTTLNVSGPAGATNGSILPNAGNLIPFILSPEMTYGLAAGKGSFQTQAFLQYLENHNMAKILAEPRLLANSGEKAKFLSGGEIPIVVAQALNTSIVFKEFGTKVTFVPTVVGVNDIELLVQPEVSDPDYAHGVQLFGFTVPAFVTRRAETQVRLRDNQTLIVAGLILHEKKETIQKVPYLGDLPYVSGLFRNTNWTDSETDLVMSVNPEIVHPLPSGSQVYLPTARPPLTADEIKTERTDLPDAGRPRF